jgi:long-chain acyl-CoA synthetase
VSNLAHILSQNAARIPDNIAIVSEGGLAQSYSDLLNSVCWVACGLEELGVQPDDHVVYQVSNGPTATILYFAILAAGAVAVPVNPLLTCEETKDVCSRTRPRLFLSEKRDHNPDLHIAAHDRCDTLPQSKGQMEIVPRSADASAVVFFTSGTTGRAKGVVLSHNNLRSNSEWVCSQSLATEQWGPGLINAAVLPLSHSFAMTCSQNATLMAGGTLTHMARFDAVRLLRQIRELGVTTIALVPSAIRSLVEAWREDQGPVPLRHCLVGGAPIPAELVHEVESSLGAEVLEGYGLTETSPVCAFRTPAIPRKRGSVGRAAGFAQLGISSGHEPDAVGEGELLVRGPGVMSGYFDSEGNEESGLVDGWLPTGDIARIDADGNVFILDRKKDVIIRNGYNVYPAEIEEALVGIEGISEAGVLGVPNPATGEEVIAFLVRDRRGLDEEAIRSVLSGLLAKFKHPRDIVFVEKIPRGAKGQVLREELRSAILT